MLWWIPLKVKAGRICFWKHLFIRISGEIWFCYIDFGASHFDKIISTKSRGHIKCPNDAIFHSQQSNSQTVNSGPVGAFFCLLAGQPHRLRGQGTDKVSCYLTFFPGIIYYCLNKYMDIMGSLGRIHSTEEKKVYYLCCLLVGDLWNDPCASEPFSLERFINGAAHFYLSGTDAL